MREWNLASASLTQRHPRRPPLLAPTLLKVG